MSCYFIHFSPYNILIYNSNNGVIYKIQNTKYCISANQVDQFKMLNIKLFQGHTEDDPLGIVLHGGGGEV